jgi:hypothetical protein
MIQKIISDGYRVTISNMTEQELLSLHFSLGQYIQPLRDMGREESLLSQCRSILKKDIIHEDDVSSFNIKKLWERLRKTHRLKIVK